jgi:hypothetical protein
MEYRLRWADLGPGAHAAYSASDTRRLVVLNTRDVPASNDLAILIRQAVDVALGTPYGRALLEDKERVLAQLDGRICPPRPRPVDLREQEVVDALFARITAAV